MSPDGGIVAVDLGEGTAVWRSSAADKPLAVADTLLISQAEAPGPANAMRIVTLTPAEEVSWSAKPWWSCPRRAADDRSVPDPVRSPPPRGPNPKEPSSRGSSSSTRTRRRRRAHGGAPRRGTSRRLGRDASGRRPGQDPGRSDGRAGTGRWSDRRPGNGAGRPPVRNSDRRRGAGRGGSRPTPVTAGDSASAWTRTGRRPARCAATAVPVRGRTSRAEQHPHRERPDWDKYLWTVFERESGRRVGELRVHLRFVPFVVVGTRVVFETLPYERRGPGRAAEPACAPPTRAPAPGRRQPVRDTVDRQPPLL